MTLLPFTVAYGSPRHSSGCAQERGRRPDDHYLYCALEHVFELQTKAVFVTVLELVHEITTVVVGRESMKNKIKDESEEESDKERKKKKRKKKHARTEREKFENRGKGRVGCRLG